MPNFPKKQQQCLIPKYLLDYATELQENHPDPSDPWGGGGGSPIEAGTGIVITGDDTKTISVDTEDVAMVSSLSSVAFSGDYDDLENKPTIPDAVSGTNDGTNWTSLTIGEDTYGLASGGTTYTAGTGIDITNDTISVDNTVAMKTDIPTNYVTTNTNQTITGSKTFSQQLVANDGIVSSGDVRISNGGLTIYDSDPLLSYSLEMNADNLLYTASNNHTAALQFVYPTNDNTLAFPDKSGTLAVTSDIITSYEDLTDKPTFATVATTGDYDDLLNKPTIPDTTHMVTDNTAQTITGNKTFGKTNSRTDLTIENYSGTGYNKLIFNSGVGNISFYNDGNNLKTQVYEDSSHYYYIQYPRGMYFGYSDNTYTLPLSVNGTRANVNTGDISITIPTATSDLTNDSGFITGITSGDVTTALGYTPYDSSNPNGYITGIDSSMVTTALGYTPGTSNFSGDYTDLTNKPTIPTVNNNTITITQGGVTKGSFTLNQNTNQTINVDDVPGMIGELLFDNASGAEGDITLSDSLANYSYIDIDYLNNENIYNTTRVYNPNGKLIGLETIYDNPETSRHYMQTIVYSLSGTSMNVQTTTLQSRLTNNAAVVVGGGTIKIRKVIGYKQNSAPIVIPDYEYHNGNTFVNSNYISSTGYISSGQKELTFTIIVPKLLNNITSVTVNKLECLLRGVGGYVNGSSNINYVGQSGYTINTYIGAPNAVTISIIKSSAFSSSTNNTPVNVAFTVGGLQLTFNT